MPATPRPSPAPEPDQVERLLDESAWVRRVALAIVRDDAQADDLAQDAWVAALRRLQAGGNAPRAWFSGTLRRLALFGHRSNARRAAREREAARPEELDDGVSALLRLEQQQIVLRAVQELGEPYRTTVIQRWLEGLEPAEIAKRSGVPVHTVYTRIARALQLLRARLGHDPEGGIRNWALAWFAGLKRADFPWPWMLAMNLKWKLGLVGSATGLLVALWFVLHSTGVPAPLAPSGDARPDSILVVAAAPPVEPETGDEAALDQSARAALAVDPGALGDEYVTQPSVRGRILDSEGKPLAGAFVSLMPAAALREAVGLLLGAPLASEGTEGAWQEATRVQSDIAGRFAVLDYPDGNIQIAIRAPRHAPFEHRGIGVPADGMDLGDITLRVGVQLVGRVVDARGVGISGVRLFARGEDDTSRPDMPATWLAAGRTDSTGYFAIDGLAPGPWELTAESDDHPRARAKGECNEGSSAGIEIRMEDGFSITGRVEGAAESRDPLAVRARYQRAANEPYDADRTLKEVLVASNGSFAVTGLKGTDGRWQLGVWRANVTDGNPAPVSRLIEANANDTGIVLSIPAATRLLVRPVDGASQQPITSANFTITSNSGYFGSLGLVPSVEREDGAHVLDLQLTDGSPEIYLTVRATGYETSSMKINTPRVGDMTDLGILPMRAAARVLVHVIDKDTRRPIDGARVRVKNEGVPFGVWRYDLSGAPATMPEPIVDATTDAAGDARLKLALGHVAMVLATADGYAASTARVEATTSAIECSVELGMGRGASVDVMVQSESTPVAGVLVRPTRLADADDGFMESLVEFEDVATDREGVAHLRHLRPGRYRLGIRLRSMPWHERGRTEVTVVDGEQRIELVLPPATELFGGVIRNGRPLIGSTVRGVVRYVRRDDGVGTVVTSAGYARTDELGRFHMEELEPGQCELLVEHPSLSLPARWTLTLHPGRNKAEYAIGESALRGLAIESSGDPIAGVVLTLSVPSGKTGFFDDAPDVVLRATTDAKGRFAFEDLPQGVPLKLAPKDGDYLPLAEPIVLRPNEVREDWKIQLERAGALHVILDSIEGKGLGRAVLIEKDGKRRAIIGTEDGDVTFRGLEPGTWMVCLRPVEDMNKVVIGETVDVVIEGGKTTELRLRVP